MSRTIRIQPKYLWFLILSYSMVMVLANWFDPRLVKLFGVVTDAGTLIFPLTFLLSDMITEVYGYKHARRAIWCGFLFNGLFLLYGYLVTHLPSPSYATQNAAFDQFMASDARIILASAISYLCAEPLNSFIMAKLKIKLAGRAMGFRFVFSTLIASGFDSCIFSLIAFYGIIKNPELLSLTLTMWLIKVIIEILGLPLSIKLTKKLKQAEHMDIYDRETQFNLFSLKVDYETKDNLLEEESLL